MALRHLIRRTLNLVPAPDFTSLARQLRPHRFDEPGDLMPTHEIRAHLRWMMYQLLDNPKTKPDKANRWIGFVQGVLWATGQKTLNELREVTSTALLVEDETKPITGPVQPSPLCFPCTTCCAEPGTHCHRMIGGTRQSFEHAGPDGTPIFHLSRDWSAHVETTKTKAAEPVSDFTATGRARRTDSVYASTPSPKPVRTPYADGIW